MNRASRRPKSSEWAWQLKLRGSRQTLLLSGMGGLICVAMMCGGCQSISHQQTDRSEGPTLAPIQASRDAVQLDIVYVERDETDPLMGKLLWGEIDQVGSVDLQTRSRLREAGFRVGLVGMSPPRSLQRLLGFTSEITDMADTSRHRELFGQTVTLRSGGETEIQTSTVYSQLELTLPGDTEPTEMSNARFVLRSELERLQDGWVKLHLTPEIHHGQLQLRPRAGAASWELKPTQDVTVFSELKFSVTLNVGEMVVVSSDHGATDLIADQFFVNRDVQRPQRRLVVVRLSDMRKIESPYQK